MTEDLTSLLARDEAAIADAIMRRMEAIKPDMYRIYRDEQIARSRCREDTAFHIQHLAAAVAVGDPAVFVEYRRWLEEMLTSRSIPTDDVELSFTQLIAEIGDRYGDVADPAVSIVETALR